MPIEIEEFKSGYLQPSAGYKFFMPSLINDQWIWSDATLNTLLEKASIRLGELNSFARLVPNIDLFLKLHVATEAVTSSRIEGTQTNITEAMLEEANISLERRDDWKEVANYAQALNDAVQGLNQLPLSSRLLRAAHRTLLQGVRGENKQPGVFRTSQNWIGGSGPGDVLFVPPAHQQIDDLMGDLENFLHNDQVQVPALIRVGIAHYQFETIHPFLDGNGRIGRLLITLYLVEQEILHRPLLYLSAYFERNKTLYYDNLMRVRDKSDMLQWLKYFLVGVEETAAKGAQTLSEVLVLKENLERMIDSEWGRRSQSARKLLNSLFVQPVVNVKQVQERVQLSKKAAGALLDKFVEAKILEEQTGWQRNRIFAFSEYLKLFERVVK